MRLFTRLCLALLASLLLAAATRALIRPLALIVLGATGAENVVVGVAEDVPGGSRMDAESFEDGLFVLRASAGTLLCIEAQAEAMFSEHRMHDAYVRLYSKMLDD